MRLNSTVRASNHHCRPGVTTANHPTFRNPLRDCYMEYLTGMGCRIFRSPMSIDKLHAGNNIRTHIFLFRPSKVYADHRCLWMPCGTIDVNRPVGQALCCFSSILAVFLEHRIVARLQLDKLWSRPALDLCHKRQCTLGQQMSLTFPCRRPALGGHRSSREAC
jgi:hypothetical protein